MAPRRRAQCPLDSDSTTSSLASNAETGCTICADQRSRDHRVRRRRRRRRLRHWARRDWAKHVTSVAGQTGAGTSVAGTTEQPAKLSPVQLQKLLKKLDDSTDSEEVVARKKRRAPVYDSDGSGPFDATLSSLSSSSGCHGLKADVELRLPSLDVGVADGRSDWQKHYHQVGQQLEHFLRHPIQIPPPPPVEVKPVEPPEVKKIVKTPAKCIKILLGLLGLFTLIFVCSLIALLFIP
ncbi:unnamed protein product [Protopolystoma xenopodis]|uniref:Uncharacterized protein n=1 Tax=Protopolystoma xenopodis TaxID=117903 RepID=A0A3S5A637_9PLAT|nr:unnamed protein product [Protopolystoma xenopodis]